MQKTPHPQFCAIPPTEFLQIPKLAERPFQMLLAQEVLKAPQRFRHLRGHIILDNGLWELKTALPFHDVIRAANELYPHVTEIILPDVLHDAIATVTLVKEHIKIYPHYLQAAVIQGNTFDEFLYCYRVFDAIPEIDVIHLPKSMDNVLQDGRAGFLHQLKKQRELSHKPHHLLGIWRNTYEIANCREYIRSVDSALPVHAAINNRTLLNQQSKSRRPRDYFELKPEDISRAQYLLMLSNIEVIDEICRTV